MFIFEYFMHIYDFFYYYNFFFKNREYVRFREIKD